MATVVVRYALRVLLVLILGGGCLAGRALAQAAASPATAGPGKTAKATPAEAAAAKAAARAARIAAVQEAQAKRAALAGKSPLAAPAATPPVAAPAATPAVTAPAGKSPAVITAPAGVSPMASPGLALDPGAAATTNNESSLARLAQPAFAEQLKLTDAQRVKITALLTERAQALAKAGLAGRAKVVDEYEQKLSDVLTAEQRATLVKPPEPRLRFNFRFQRWIDVLEWFAKEADLSLVLDSPPPGTFNYSDTREYTPLEAIDLLNGVLLTKGFTLLRRERMLLVINLADGLPEGLIPRVTVEELDKRGKFEFVSVLFPLVGRNTTEVITEIKPLLGPYGKVTPLPVSAQILVTDTAGVMRAVGAVIQSMPPSPNAPVSPYETPQLVVYSLKSADPTGVMQVLRSLMPTAPVVLDPKSFRISVFAGPTQQATTKSVVDQMEAAAAPEEKPQLELYPLGDTSPAAAAQLLATLQTMFPKAKLSLDARGNRVIAWATPADHQALAIAVGRLNSQNTRGVQAYRLTTADPIAMITLLRTLVPGASVTYDAGSHDLIALAVPADQATVKATVEQLQREVPEADRSQMVAYPVVSAEPSNVMRVLRGMFPAAQILLDTKTRRLIVTALPAVQAAIKAALEKIDSGTPAETQESFMVYPLGEADAKVAVRMFTELYPDMHLAADVKSSTLLAWGRKADQDSLAETVKQMVAGGDLERKPRLVVYTMGATDAAAAALMFKTLVPSARVALDPKTGNLAAWGTPRDHELIKAAIEQLSQKTPDKAFRVEVYLLGASAAAGGSGADAGAADSAAGKGAGGKGAAGRRAARVAAAAAPGILQWLKTMFPDAQLFLAADSSKLIAWARPADHEAIRSALEEITKKEPAGVAPKVVVYTLTTTTAAAAMPILRTMFPDVQFSAGAEPSKVVAYARPADQDEVAKVIELISAKEPAETARRLEIYSLETPTAAIAMITLRGMFPMAMINAGSDPNKVAVYARPADQEAIKAVVAQLGQRESPETAPMIVAYTLNLAGGPAGKGGKGAAAAAASGAGAAGALPTLRTLFPAAQFFVGADPGRLIVSARKADHQAIQKALDEIVKQEPAETAPRIVVYYLESTTSTVALPILRALLPNAQFSPGAELDQVVAFARPTEHEAIRTAVRQISEKEAAKTARRVEIYSLETPTAATTILALKTIFPLAQFSVGSDPGKVMAWARPADHEAIREVIAQLARREPAETAPSVAIYTLDLAGAAGGRGAKAAGGTGAAGAIPALKLMFPAAQFTVGADPARLVVFARKADHAAIQKTVEEMARQEPAATARTAVSYTLEATTSTTVLPVLTAMFPNAQFSAGTDPSQVIALARPGEHEAIKAALLQISKREPAETAPAIVVYTLPGAAGGKGGGKSGGAAATMATLRILFPTALFSAGSDPSRLIVAARPADQAAIKKAIDDLSTQESPQTAPRAEIYTLQATTAAAVLPVLTATFPNAQFSAGADPSQVVAMARPADHEAIRAAIQQMSKREPPETAPTVAVYTLDIPGAGGKAGAGAKAAAGAAAVATLKTMFPLAQFSVGADPSRLIVWARTADHAEIRKAVEEMGRQEPAEKSRRVITYTLKSTTALTALPILTAMFPNAQFSAGDDPSQVIALARPADHEAIAKAIQQMAEHDPKDLPPTIAVYTLPGAAGGKGGAKAGGAAAAIAALKPLFPTAQFSAGSDPNRLIVAARPADHEAIKKAIDDLSKQESPQSAPRAEIYTLQATTAAAVLPVLTATFPNAQFSAGADPSQVVVMARPADHEAIQAAIQQMSKHEPPETAPTVAVYTLDIPGATGKTGASAKAAGSAAAVATLKTMFPLAQFSVGADPSRLIVWARKADHAEIKKAVEQMGQQEPPEKARRVVTYTLKSATAVTALPVLTAMFPSAQFSAGDDPSQVIALARPAEHEAIARAIQQMAEHDPKDLPPAIVVYNLPSPIGKTGGGAKSGAAAAAMPTLKTLFPAAQFSTASDPSQLIVAARPADQAAIKKAIDELSQPAPADAARRAVSYHLESATAVTVLPVLSGMFPNALFTAGDDPSVVIALARPAEHEAIAQAIRQIAQREPAGTAPTIVVYGLPSGGASGKGGSKSGLAAAAISSLKTMFPAAQFSVGADPSRLIVAARPADHAAIKLAIDGLSKRESVETAPRVVVYTLGTSGATTALSALPLMFPDAQFSAGGDPAQIVAWARPADQEAIRTAVEQIAKRETAETAPRVMVYTVQLSGIASGKPGSSSSKSGGAAALLPNLKTMFPDAQFAVGADSSRLVAWARPADQAAIKLAVDEMSKEEPLETAPRVVMYTVDLANAAAVLPILQSLFPTAQFSVGANPSQVVALARPADQALIAKSVAELSKREPADTAATVAVYRIPISPLAAGKGTSSSKAGSAAAAATALSTMFPVAQFSVGSDPTQLIVSARPADHPAIKKAVDEMSKVAEQTSVVYRFQRADPMAAQTVLATLVPMAQIAVDTTARTLVASALPEDQARIKATVAEMDRDDANNQTPRMEVRRVMSADAGALVKALQALYKSRLDVQVSLDDKDNAVVAVAPPLQQELIRTLIEQADRGGLADTGAQLQLYSLQDMDGPAVMAVLTGVFAKQGSNVQLSIEPRTNQLVAMALPAYQAIIRAALAQMKSPERPMEVIPLNAADAATAQTAIDRLFAENGVIRGPTAPQVDVDPIGQQLFIRATKDQFTQIRKLLAEMGEANMMEKEKPPASTGHTRVIPFQGDAASAMREILKAWPQLRPNPIHVVTPQGVIIDQTSAAAAPVAAPAAEPATPAKEGPQQAVPAKTESAATKDREPARPVIVLPPSQHAPKSAPQRSTPQRSTPQRSAPQRSTPQRSTPQRSTPQRSTPQRSTPQRSAPPKSAPARPPAEAPRPKAKKKRNTAQDAAGSPSIASGRAWRFFLVSDSPQSAADDTPAGAIQLAQAPAATAAGTSAQNSATPATQAAQALAPAAATPAERPMAVAPPVTIPITATPATAAASGTGIVRAAPAAAPAATSPAPAPPPAAAAKGSIKGAPIVITPGDTTVTISSDDLEALDQLEPLVRSYSQGGSMGRNLVVFLLRNAKASVVATTLQTLYKSIAATRRAGTPTGTSSSTSSSTSAAASPLIAMPDDRLNALVVQANRADLPTIENLVRMLDSSNVRDSLAAARMKLIPVKNTSAAQILSILPDAFKTQADSIGVEDQTNSLVVMAPASLTEEITRFVNTVDEAVGAEPSQKVKIIQLRNSNSMIMQKTIDMILKGGSSKSSSGSSRSSYGSSRSSTGSSSSGSSSSGSGSSSSGTRSGN